MALKKHGMNSCAPSADNLRLFQVIKKIARNKKNGSVPHRQIIYTMPLPMYIIHGQRHPDFY
jgi:hypothetical protein